jgi:hypothetical protein
VSIRHERWGLLAECRIAPHEVAAIRAAAHQWRTLLKAISRTIHYRRTRRLRSAQIVWSVRRTGRWRSEIALLSCWTAFVPHLLETRPHRPGTCCGAIIAHPWVPLREPLGTNTAIWIMPFDPITKWTRAETIALRFTAWTAMWLSRCGLRSVTVAPRFAWTRLGLSLSVVTWTHFVRRDTTIAVAIELPQSFRRLVEFGRIECAVAISIEHSKNSGRYATGCGAGATAIASISWRLSRWIILGAERPRGKRERHGGDQSCSFHRSCCLRRGADRQRVFLQLNAARARSCASAGRIVKARARRCHALDERFSRSLRN